MRLSSSPIYSTRPVCVTTRSVFGGVRIFSTLGLSITRVLATVPQPSANKAQAQAANQRVYFFTVFVPFEGTPTIYAVLAVTPVHHREVPSPVVVNAVKQW